MKEVLIVIALILIILYLVGIPRERGPMNDFAQGMVAGMIVGVLATLAVLFIWGGE